MIIYSNIDDLILIMMIYSNLVLFMTIKIPPCPLLFSSPRGHVDLTASPTVKIVRLNTCGTHTTLCTHTRCSKDACFILHVKDNKLKGSLTHSLNHSPDICRWCSLQASFHLVCPEEAHSRWDGTQDQVRTTLHCRCKRNIAPLGNPSS